MDFPPTSKAGTRSHRAALSRMVAAAGLAIAMLLGLCAGAPLPARGADVAMNELMASEALPDVPVGASDAPVTIIEYASTTCTHCAAFSATTFPELKRKYIDTGKARFILREFPLNPLATAGFMLARCSGDDKRNAVIDLLFAQLPNWAFKEKPADAVEALAGLLKQTGMSQKSFDACLSNQALLDKIMKVHDRAADKFGVAATPTFFINGKMEKGEITPDRLEKLLAQLLKG